MLVDSAVESAVAVIDRSGIVALLQDASNARKARLRAHAANGGAGGRPRTGIEYTVKALMVAFYLQLSARRPVTWADLLDLLLQWTTDHQLAMLGMKVTPVQRTTMTDARLLSSEYQRFTLWANEVLAGIDPNQDLPARRTTEGERAAALASRSLQQREESQIAEQTARLVVNALIAASVLDANPEGYEGDVVIDETIFKTANIEQGMGTRPHRRRSAVPGARVFVRERGTVSDDAGTSAGGAKNVTKSGFGIGVTAVVRVGRPGSIRNVVPLITAVDIHHPTSGNVDGAANALESHLLNGFAPSPKHRANSRRPLIVVDMGYNPKRGWAEMVHRHGYTWIGRYPAKTNPFSHADNAAGSKAKIPPGPVFLGNYYCPKAGQLLQAHAGDMNRRSRDIGSAEATRAHDHLLSQLLPLLMGLNSRPKPSRPLAGRPAKDREATLIYTQEQVCPAVQNRCRCPLKPESMDNPTAITIEPEWTADAYRCCSKSSITVAISDLEFRNYQGMVPGSWEHTYYLEAYRSLNERAFSVLKSPNMVAVDLLNFGPRRDAALSIIIGMAIVISNLKLQSTPNLNTVDSVTERFAKLDGQLGRPATRVPPRT